MARKKQLAAIQRKQALCDELAASRIALAHGRDLLKNNLNVKDQLGKKIFGISENLGDKVSGGFTPLNLLRSVKPSIPSLSIPSLNLPSLNLPGLYQSTLGKVDKSKVIFGSALLGVVAISLLARRSNTEKCYDNNSEDYSKNKRPRKKRKIRLSISSFLIGVAVKQVRKTVTKVVTKKVKSHIKDKLIQKATNLVTR